MIPASGPTRNARRPVIRGGSARSPSATCCFCWLVASGIQANSVTCLIIAILSVAAVRGGAAARGLRAGPREQPGRGPPPPPPVAPHRPPPGAPHQAGGGPQSPP